MSITLKSMRAGKVSVNEFNTYPEMLPVLMKIHGMNLPYYVLEDGKMIFQGNLEFVEKEKDAPVSYTLKTMNEDGMTDTAQFTNFADLSIAAAVADINHMPWFVVDNHSGKIIRQGNIERVAAIKSGNAPETCVAEEPVPETPDVDVDIDATLDEMNDLIGDPDALDNI